MPVPLRPLSSTKSAMGFDFNYEFLEWNSEELLQEWSGQLQEISIQPLKNLSFQLKEIVNREKDKLQNGESSKLSLSQCQLIIQQSIHSLTSILMKNSEIIQQQLDQIEKCMQYHSSKLTGITELFQIECDAVYLKSCPTFDSSHQIHTFATTDANEVSTSVTNLKIGGRKNTVIFKDDPKSSPSMLVYFQSNSPYRLSTLFTAPTPISVPILLSPGKLNLHALDHIGVTIPPILLQSKQPSVLDFFHVQPSTSSSCLAPSQTTLGDALSTSNIDLSAMKSSLLPKALMATVIHPYSAQARDELDLIPGEKVEILELDAGEGWTLGNHVNQSKKGLFPRGYVELME